MGQVAPLSREGRWSRCSSERLWLHLWHTHTTLSVAGLRARRTIAHKVIVRAVHRGDSRVSAAGHNPQAFQVSAPKLSGVEY